MNDKKYLSSFEKGTLANKGKVYKDTTISLTHNPDPYVSPKKKQQPPLPEKHRGSIASVITYENVYHRPDVKSETAVITYRFFLKSALRSLLM